jgi:uncharacterized coiled-coil protein SlyX
MSSISFISTFKNHGEPCPIVEMYPGLRVHVCELEERETFPAMTLSLIARRQAMLAKHIAKQAALLNRMQEEFKAIASKNKKSVRVTKAK